MTSLNGDVFVMRNGRSTSQVSIYNYPEHLNPFYEDEQHKRLRFWKINKSNGSGSRRNSFSLSGLKDVWAFKSFRLKKKSSTLGINKTSESPPALRRDLYSSENGNDLSLPDYKTRYSTPAGSIDNFQRNAGYRSSLQNVAHAKNNTGSQLDFNRNNQYRSTIQVMGTKSKTNYNNNNTSLRTTPVPQPRRYVYGGSVTPQPLRNSNIGSGVVGLSNGSSQISMASTNPFDTDDDEEENNEDVSLAGDRQMITSTPIKQQRMHRKKRRAPAPPAVGVHKAAPSPDSSLNGSLHPQPLPELRIEECMDIANLTAAIEDFVKTTNDDEPISPSSRDKQAVQEVVSTSTTSTSQNGDVRSIHNSTPQSPSLKAEETKDVSVIETKQKSDNSAPPEKEELSETDNSEMKISAPLNSNNTPEVGHLECIHVHMGNQSAAAAAVAADRVEPSQMSSFRGSQTRSPTQQQPITTKTSFTLTTPPAERRDSTKKTKITLQNTETLKFPETEDLRITEDVTTPKAIKSPTTTTKPAVSAKPHVAEIHKPSRGIASARTDEHKEIVVKEIRQPPTSPVPPVRHSTIVKQREGAVVKTTETESESTRVQQINNSQVLSNVAVPTTSSLSLTITESHEDLLEKDEATSHISSDNKVASATTTPAHRTQSPTELREEALESLYRPKPSSSYLEWKQSSLAPLEKNVPPEKRKSVKDIIESINRSQRLLHASAHKDIPNDGTSPNTGAGSANGTPLPQRRLSGQSTNEMHSTDANSANGTPLPKRKFSGQSTIEKQATIVQSRTKLNGNATTTESRQEEDTPTTSAAASASGAAEDGSENVNGGQDSEQDPQKLNNNEIFKKCTVKKEVQYDYREQSPTTSNLDWNPVPKPKRNKNLSEQ
ncbi:general transcriptional corepressor trfA isoform X1 [Rhagoletis pomonella]|uniref:general transcriptional corepressor trfA isoform X1 n=1 Tax=Rhagoletis pomonella TaxID=28610 RepID=UPI0017858A1B|nr:general transcriptional corepressor trfA isoform X1 [Rhagoletis pomonella]XP_036321121.1 general transcriptional corepressor trfA isoform X1 [Rhagoletis pomonella]XP_036321122.1 general transcriptional corepressor trfA isoform X1 [Rhagoletis pomonella]